MSFFKRGWFAVGVLIAACVSLLMPSAAFAGPATHFSVSAPGSATAGVAFNFTVTALDAGNATDTGYSGTVHFTSSDGAGVIPANATLVNGVGTFSATLKTAGSQTITATDTVTSSITGTSNSIAVLAAAATHFQISAPASSTAGNALSFNVFPEDQFGNLTFTYSGTVHFTSSDGAAVLPANSNVTAGIGFTATLNTTGNQTITATDTVTPSITGTSAAINVTTNAATHFTISAPASVTAGTAFSVTVTARDGSNSVATGYTGTVHFTSSDVAGVLPANATLTNGVGTFSVTLNTGGAQTVTATDTVTSSITGLATITVTTNAATHFVVSAPASATAGAAFNFTVTARDAGNATATGYTGTVHFTSSDVAAVLPANATLTNGVGTFSATLNTSGAQTITATDTVTSSITGLATITVSAATTSTTTSVTSSANPSTAGQNVTFTATVSGGAATGSVTFKDGGTVLGVVTLAGGHASFTTSSLTTGNHAITAAYGGDANFAASTSAALNQVVNMPADSLKLRALQVLVTPMVAQVSGQAISGAVDSAISEGFNDGGAFVAPSGNGVRFNFAADPDAQTSGAAPRATDPFSSVSGSLAGARASASQASASRIDDAFGALAYAGPAKAPPRRIVEPKEWLGWAEVRGATLDRWGNLSAAPGASVVYGNQVNLLAGLTRKLTPNFLVGVLGGYETFDYRSDALTGRLKGDGWTVGSYLGWKLTQDIRFDAAVAYSGIGYDGTAGTAAGSFGGNRWLVTSGLTGTYRSLGVQIEPSARVYALWEHENAYTDTLGTLQAARDFSTGRASGGVKLSYPIAWSGTAVVSPYAGLYGDYYFNNDSSAAAAAAAALVPAAFILDGWSARAVGGVTANFINGAQLAVGAERGGIGGNFGLWTYRARASIPFSAQ